MFDTHTHTHIRYINNNINMQPSVLCPHLTTNIMTTITMIIATTIKSNITTTEAITGVVDSED